VLLALDARNGGLTLGFKRSGAWLPLARLGSERTADEYAFLFEAALQRAGGGQGATVQSAWLSSVVPALSPRLIEGVRLAFGLETQQLAPGVKTGVKIRTDQPSELGSDLVCQAVAAYALVQGACIVADFGAALTFIALNGAGELLGAAIAPGLDTAALALRGSAAQLPQVRLDLPERAIGKNSAAAVRSGIVLGYRGLADAIISGMREELAEDAALIGSGDELGRRLLDGLGCRHFVPDLALEGLALIAQRNGYAPGA
jgi:type III pantothenate kinase